MDLQYVSAGHPFKGRRALQPHQGAHIHWDNSTDAWPKGGVGVTNYPAIYAVADGYVDRIDYSFKVGTNDRDGATLMPVCMGYLLEADENPFGTGAAVQGRRAPPK